MMSDEDKEEKPKKAFQIKAVVWDDGEVDVDIREFRKLGTGRGAPSLCGPLSPDEFKKYLKLMSLSPDGVCEALAEEIGIQEPSEEDETTPMSSSIMTPDDDDVEDELLDVRREVHTHDDDLEPDSDLSEEVPDFSDLEID
jgi:hypothetical protein